MDNISQFEFLTKIEHCVNDNGSADDFAELEGEMFSKNSVLIENPFITDEYDELVLSSTYNFLSVFAERFPERFLIQDNANISDSGPFIYKAMLRDIFAGRRSAETLAEIVFAPFFPDSYFNEALTAAVLSGNDSFFEYFIQKVENPVRYVSKSIYMYFTDHGMYDHIERIFRGASREEILAVCRNSIGQLLRQVDIKCKKMPVEYLYELTGYLPGNVSAEERSRIVIGIMEEVNDWEASIFSDRRNMLVRTNKTEKHWGVDTWKYMNEHGIKIRSLDFLFGNKLRFNISDEKILSILSLIQEYIVPILEDKLIITEKFYAFLSKSQQELVIRFVELIGADRVYMDCTDKNCSFFDDEFFNENTDGDMKARSLAKTGVHVILDDDIRNSYYVSKLLLDVECLGYMLDGAALTDEQIDTLIDICVEKKLFDAMNAVRKYVDRKISSKLKK